MTDTPVPVPGLALTPAAAQAAAVDAPTLIRRWLEGKSPTARRTYGRSLARFAAWAIAGDVSPEAGMRVLCEAGPGPAHSMAEKWRDELLTAGLAPGTVAGMVTALASLVRCARRAGLVTWSLEGVAPRVERRHDRSGPRRGDVERLVAFIDDEASHGQRRAIRDAALVRCMYACGLRRAEVANLRLEDADLSTPALRPRRKGKREREATTISPGTATALRRWLDVRGTEPGALFVRTDRREGRTHLCGEAIRKVLASWARRAGLRGPVRPHGLRHSGATEVASRGSLEQLMSYGGWASLTSASQYLDKRAESRVAAMGLVDL